MEGGPNFAGNYSLAQATRGTGCADIGVVNLRTGKVFDEFPFGFVHFGPHEQPYGKVVYRADSRLLELEGRIDRVSDSPVRAYYVWQDPGFKLLKVTPLARP
jgi:hypothetical protein